MLILFHAFLVYRLVKLNFLQNTAENKHELRNIRRGIFIAYSQPNAGRHKKLNKKYGSSTLIKENTPVFCKTGVENAIFSVILFGGKKLRAIIILKLKKLKVKEYPELKESA